ncbi:MAG: bifunctional phosphoribosyl-AMP cyclohydrolase/phosphoribosyl-ATP diphosphatase HisIE [Saprospiraceae bacterium]|nr:bifunctional phosphoribosyl-AMP cyclohydrolase/phosphoribosyl-ATP diphosphatase HisIE [Saprospiraceae bacterium]
MTLDFEKGDGLVPVVIQHADSLHVLMLGYMNAEALEQTRREGKVTFFSRSKNRLWTKGETSGNFLWVSEMREDCDSDALLVKVRPEGPVCHTGAASCFREESPKGFLYELEQTIAQRIDSGAEDSYTSRLVQRGINKVAQKVGEEAVELVIEAKDNDPDLFKGEAADLLYHLLILLKAKGFSLEEVEAVLRARSKK